MAPQVGKLTQLFLFAGVALIAILAFISSGFNFASHDASPASPPTTTGAQPRGERSRTDDVPAKQVTKAPQPTGTPPPTVDVIRAAAVVKAFYDEAPFKCPDRRITLDELRQHTKDKDLWILINGFVLDVTTYLPEHPGGRTLTRAAGGVDGAELFTQFHESGTVKRYFARYCIGRLAA